MRDPDAQGKPNERPSGSFIVSRYSGLVLGHSTSSAKSATIVLLLQISKTIVKTSRPLFYSIIPAGGYLQLAYQFRLQPGVFVPIVLELTQIKSEAVMFFAINREDAANASGAAAGHPADECGWQILMTKRQA